MPVNNPNNQPLLVGYGQSQGLINIFPYPIISNRDPGVNDRKAIGVVWVNKLTNAAWVLTSISNAQANWLAVGGGGGAGVFTDLTVTPGPTSITGTTNINTSGAEVTNIGVGGTGAVNLGNATGNTVISAGDLEVTNGSITVDIGDVIATLGNIEATAGNITAGGVIQTVDGNVELGTAGNKLVIVPGANASIGTATLVAGTVTVATTAVTASSIIFISRNTPGGTVGDLSVPSGSIVAATSFDIASDSNTDTSTVNWWIIN